MQDLELVSPDFVICDDCRTISTTMMADSKSKPVRSYRIAQILDNGLYKVGDRVVMSTEGAKIKLRDNPVEYWMFDVKAIIGKVERQAE